MAIEFFDRLTASVSKTAKQVSDNAKSLADKNRVRKDIAAMENELRNRFRDIGEKYFLETKDNPAPEYAEMFSAIGELQTGLAAKQRELESLDGVRWAGSRTGSGNPSRRVPLRTVRSAPRSG